MTTRPTYCMPSYLHSDSVYRKEVLPQSYRLQLWRWGALTSYLEDRAVAIDNNWVENQFWPVAIGGHN